MAYKIERVKPHYLELGTVTVTAGGTSKQTVTLNDDMTIQDIFFIETAGVNTKKVTVSIQIEDEIITHDKAPLYLFDPENRYKQKITLVVRNGEKMTFGFENNDTTDASITIIAVITK